MLKIRPIWSPWLAGKDKLAYHFSVLLKSFILQILLAFCYRPGIVSSLECSPPPFHQRRRPEPEIRLRDFPADIRQLPKFSGPAVAAESVRASL